MDSEADDLEEQLRGRQNDEFKELKEALADQLVDLRKLVKMSRNPKKRKRHKLWLPLDLTVKISTRPEPIAGFELHIKCTRKYPLLPPAIGFKNVRGIGRTLIAKLHKQLKQEAANEEIKGQGCIMVLIMRAQQFLDDHYGNLELNNKSFYDQMVEQKQTYDRKAEMSRRRQDEMDRLERERQVEEIRQKILKKRELYNESRRRRDSQNSTVENDQEDSTYDYDGDLDGDSTTTSLTDDLETNRLTELEEVTEDGETLVKSRRSTFVGNRDCQSGDIVDLNTGTVSQSRIGLEYEVIEELGHGGFGTVYKVRNRVDSRLYALKKVKLNPDNEVLNEKIMREVRLLSRLNHENVIRYYTAWNETEVKKAGSKLDSTTEVSSISRRLSQESCILSPRFHQEFSDNEADDVYHTSYLINEQNVEKVSSGETTANYVVFEASDNKDENDIVESMKKALGPSLSDEESTEEEDECCSSNSSKVKINRWLYIQMELGQGTLREAIDLGLPKQKDRARRFFREILDGLCHIHRQGIIHRDLKPVNIFLDSMDRPKIGDFGLATTNLFIVTQSNFLETPTATAIKPNRLSLERLRQLASPDRGESPGDGLNKSGERLKYIHCNQTDNIGTPLYMSPELSATNEKTRIAKVVYSHKVDVYSLGIIYFEMLYPLMTGHERFSTLQNLRKKSITMPSDVETHLTKEDVELIRLLLTHDVATRPTSEKLLLSNLLPSVGMKEREYQNIIKQVVQNRQARTHKHMLRLLFEQNDSYVDDFVFDFDDVSCSTPSASAKLDPHNLLKDFNTNCYVLDQVKMKLEQLLRSKGYVNFVTPSLMPKYSASKYYSKQQLEDAVMLMDKNSSILTLPYDLRLPFARSIARTNINYINRFAMEKIFRQRQILGYHPDQLWECCVDIVTPPLPTGVHTHLADSEILSLMSDVVKSIQVILPLRPIIKVNHIQLVRSIMLMLSIEEDSIDELLNCIAESIIVSMKRMPKTMHAGQTSLSFFSSNGSLPQHIKEDLREDLLASRLLTSVTLISSVINMLYIVGNTPLEILDQIEQFYNSKSLKTANHLEEIRLILRSLDETIHYARGLGLDLPVMVSPGFVLYALRPVNFYSGMVCMLECKRHHKAKMKSQLSKSVILAVGGRYDRLIEEFSRHRSEVFDRSRTSETSGDKKESDSRAKVAVGVSFEVEKFSRFVLEDYVDKITNSDQSTTPNVQQLVQLNSQLVTSMHNPPTNLQLPIRYWPLDIAICSLTHPKPRSLGSLLSSLIRQLRGGSLICNEIIPSDFPYFSLSGLTMQCVENRIPYLMTVKSQSIDLGTSEDSLQIPMAISPTAIGPSSPSATHKHDGNVGLGSLGCIATLYQLDKGRLKEVKRCDVPGMINYLLKR